MRPSKRFLLLAVPAFFVLPLAAHASVIITEIMYDVPSSIGADDTREWVEIANSGAASVDLTGWKFSDGANHVLNAPPANGGVGSLTLPAGAVAILADDAATFLGSLYPSYAGTLIDTTMSLNNTGATLEFIDENGSVEDSVTYAKTMGAAGDGNTLQWNGSAFTAAEPTPGSALGIAPPPGGDTPDTNDSSTTSPEATDTTSNQGSNTYVPPPSALSFGIVGSASGEVEVPMHFSAVPKLKSGATDPAAQVAWSFGDGSADTGSAVEKTYHYAGSYLVTAVATDGDTTARASLTVTVSPATPRISALSAAGITLANDSSLALDLSGWRLTSGIGSFRFPDGTELLPGASVLFASSITGLPIAFDATLFYPDGMTAARYAPPDPAPVQPPAPATSSPKQQTVESAVSSQSAASTNVPEPIGADAGAATTPPSASAVAASTSEAGQPAAVLAASASHGLLHSPWIYGALGLVAVAGGALLIF